jgi:hypothetical protein
LESPSFHLKGSASPIYPCLLILKLNMSEHVLKEGLSGLGEARKLLQDTVEWEEAQH